MTIQTTNLIAGIDPEIKEILVSNRREFFSGSAAKLGLMASAPVLLAMTAQNAFGQELPKDIVDVLVFALTLEHIEDAFYRSGLDAPDLIPEEYVGIFNQIGKHEAAHVAFLTTALGSAAIERPALDLTAGGTYADALTNFDTYLTLSQTFEDLGVAAYKGQAGVLAPNDDILTAALQIHSVEARHAAIVARRAAPWRSPVDP